VPPVATHFLRPWTARVPGIAAAFSLLLSAILVPSAFAQGAVQFDGTNDYITFGQATSTLGTPTFTIECWFMRTGAGITTSTGTGGVTNAVPLLTKGRGEAEASTVDMNYFLGIRASDSVLVADFEEGTGQLSPGLNHPVIGVTQLARNVWYHAAATFDGTNFRVYLNGILENTVVVGAGRLPQSASIQHAGLATGLTSANPTSVAAGFFAGRIDEARIWNHSRPQAGIRDSALLEIPSSPGLLGRWGLNDGAGATAVNSIAGSPAGTLTNSPTWVAGAPFSFERSLQFHGTDSYVNFGNPAALRLPQWTVECWFRRDGNGQETDTGAGGVADAIPLVTKGRGEIDSATVNVNYFLGFDQSSGVIIADFEEADTGGDPGQNHPAIGTTSVGTGAWHHAAATYDGSNLKVYLDGFLEDSVFVGQPCGSDGTHPVGIATGLDRQGDPEGFLDGTIDEVRIWSTARTAAQIAANFNNRITGTASGLVARWGLDEGTGTAVASSAGTTLNGTIIGTPTTGWNWSNAAPFNLASPTAPAPPTALNLGPVTSSNVHLTWADNSNNEAEFVVERSASGPGGPYTVIAGTAANATSYDDNTVSAGTGYCYTVHAVNGAGASASAGPSCVTTPTQPRTALDFGASTYVTFGDANAVDLPAFTVECWFRRDANGTVTTTGTGGVTSAIPLVTNGRGESEDSDVDLNWFLGVRDSDDVVFADFEEGAAGSNPSLNHPVIGVTPITLGIWHHVAASYDGSTWNLYLDGNLESTLLVGQPVASASTQHNAIATGLTSAGVAQGQFEGVIDEVRVWNSARNLTQIRGTANAELDVPTPGLVARWSLDEGSGTAVNGSAGTSANGTVSGANFTWVGPAPFNLEFNDPPAIPSLVAPSNAATGVGLSPSLQVQVSDPNADSVTVTFYGSTPGGAPGPDFTIIPIPDTQYYTGQLNGGSSLIMKSQMDWIVANRTPRNIVYAVQLGDCTEHGQNGDNITNNPIEWMRADTAFKKLENPVTTGLVNGIPYGVCVGNHDQTAIGNADGSTAFYNQYFGIARFTGRPYYGGPHRGSNDNWFDLFSASGMDFITIGLEYDTTPDVAVLNWADSLLKAYPNRRGILASHNFLGAGNPGTFSTQGSATYEALKDNPNFFLMLCGHVNTEGRRSETFEGRTVNVLMSDYQGRTNGGDGWLRIMEFSPANNVIRVRTYSPWLGQFEADADSSSQFTLAYPMTSGGGFAVIGTVKVASGQVASLAWPGRAANTSYQWYAVASDGQASTSGPTWSFTTGAGGNQAPTATVVSPNGGNTLYANTTVNLTWTATDDAAVTSITLLLSRNGSGGQFDTLASGLANTGSYSWLVTAPATSNAFLKVIARDAGNLTGQDISNTAFAISTGPTGVEDGTPLEFALSALKPNPSAGATHIGFAVPRTAPVRITVHDVMGREVARIADRAFAPGRYDLGWDARSGSGRVPAGLYFVRMHTPERTFTRRLVLIP